MDKYVSYVNVEKAESNHMWKGTDEQNHKNHNYMDCRVRVKASLTKPLREKMNGWSKASFKIYANIIFLRSQYFHKNYYKN